MSRDTETSRLQKGTLGYGPFDTALIVYIILPEIRNHKKNVRPHKDSILRSQSSLRTGQIYGNQRSFPSIRRRNLALSPLGG